MDFEKKVFMPFASPVLDDVARFFEGCEVFYTCVCEDLKEDVERKINEYGRAAGGLVTPNTEMETISPAVIECAETLGAIDRIVFAPEINAEGRLFLDLSEDQFNDHINALKGFFMLCKCALPYMLGRDKPEIIVRLPQDRRNLTVQVYRAAIMTAANNLSEELAQYHIEVRLV